MDNGILFILHNLRVYRLAYLLASVSKPPLLPLLAHLEVKAGSHLENVTIVLEPDQIFIDMSVQQEKRPDQLSICLDLLCSYMDCPGLFRPEAVSCNQVSNIASSLAESKAPSPSQVSNLLILWLKASSIQLLPRHLQLEILKLTCHQPSQCTNAAKLQKMQQIFKMERSKDTDLVSVTTLLLFLQEYLLHQKQYTQERESIAKVFAPILFQAALTEGVMYSLKCAEDVTSMLISQAIAVLTPQMAAAASLLAKSRMCTITNSCCQEKEWMSSEAQSGALKSVSSDTYDEFWRADPHVTEVMTRLIDHRVTDLLFCNEEEEDWEYSPSYRSDGIVNPGTPLPSRLTADYNPAIGKEDCPFVGVTCHITAKPSVELSKQEQALMSLPTPFSTPFMIPGYTVSAEGMIAEEPLLEESLLASLLMNPMCTWNLNEHDQKLLMQQYTFPLISVRHPDLPITTHTSCLYV
ncbi:hypothetical protein CEUSTIGMA_g10165.t1 [Chlamydomonas eustigma]|uniref:Rho-GAP domain-containing protein n=1 Tax=Chlamydomonas eustigma TaxID=1157962 RepID=A0A250XIJ6_9CHLO|nr:hypothetical protein CEUSTIGMA_g10165.t1 [Chlamydomonas eustigma]|eukprot:GAX82739.1 hypothetical protein CEUSTIGMA_g10165.t1 [Chlamydomonas eustigma]